MGNGSFGNGRLDFIVSSSYPLTAAENAAVRADLQAASDFLFRATGGQVAFGEVYLVDEGLGRFDAEITLFDTPGAISGGSRGQFGVAMKFCIINKSDRSTPSVIVHEFAHHLWDLGDEYSGSMQAFQINKSVAAPNNLTIPVVLGQLPAGSIAGQSVILAFAGDNNRPRKVVESNTPTIIRVGSNDPFPDLPTNSIEAFGWRQDTRLLCSPDGATCIMQDRQKTLFCTDSNHAAVETEQEELHHESCWSTIQSRPGFGTLTVPNSTPAPPYPVVNFQDLEKPRRYALVFDVSGSMAGDKLLYTQQGVKYWLESLAMPNDFLSLIAFNTANNVILPLSTLASVPGSIAGLASAVDALTASGNTNIRDAVVEGVQQITSRPNRAVTQAVVLLTDGKHNRPQGTSLLESLSDLDAAGVRAMTLGVGHASQVDSADLQDLSDATNGLAYLVDPGDPIAIETALVEIYVFLASSVADSGLVDFVPAPPQKKYGPSIRRLYKTMKSPSLRDVLALLPPSGRTAPGAGGLPFDGQLFQQRSVYVERGCTEVSFTTNHRVDAEVDIFLIDPSGQEVVDNGVSVVKRTASESHEIMAVRRPATGIWRLVVLLRKPTATGPTRVNFTVGAANPKITAWGGPTKAFFAKGKAPSFRARAAYDGSPLSGLRVEAELRPQAGPVQIVKLVDGGLASKISGEYVGSIAGLKRGSYRGVIRIESASTALKAMSRQLMSHLARTPGPFNFQVRCGRFSRCIPFAFEKG